MTNPAAVIAMAAPAILIGLGAILIYVLGKFPRGATPEPKLGARVYIGALLSICVQLGIVGVIDLLAVLVDGNGEATGPLGVIFGAALAAIMPIVMWQKLKLGLQGSAVRQLVGLNACLTGLVATVLTVQLGEGLVDGRDVGLLAVRTIAYTAAAIAFTVWLGRLVEDAEEEVVAPAPQPSSRPPTSRPPVSVKPAATEASEAPAAPAAPAQPAPKAPPVHYDKPTDCVACESDDLAVLAPGAYRCKACGYEGGPGYDAYKKG